ncbi:MAG: triose-phosphate isomerase, partial [Bacteroidetes bacterium]|nr:triose-phosphate isomerase [Bacteroidota bacterium]
MIIAGNWKMNLDRGEALELVNSIANEDISASIDVRMAVPALYLPILNELVEEHSNISIGAQNIHQEESGAYTGEISAKMLVSCGINWTIVGHSERRELFDETDEYVRTKCARALGDGQSVREEERHENFVKSQIMDSLPKNLNGSQLSQVIIAYEPVWAIGTGLTASPAQAQSMHSFIRSELNGKFGEPGSKVPILYGGSMNPSNASDLLSQPD